MATSLATKSASPAPATISKLLIANRGEIAIRIARAAGELRIPTVAVYTADDELSLHTRKADEAHALAGRGARGYLDVAAIIAAAKATGCDGLHPGYGFLSENVALAEACAENGIVFVGPSPTALGLFGDKTAARELAQKVGVPVIPGTTGATTLEEATAFFDGLGEGAAIMIKAIAGGGGRGMRPVTTREELAEAYARCRSEAKAAFGDEAVYVERLMRNARHIEVQIIGDRAGNISHLYERECTIQRRNQKIVEVAPSPALTPALRERITLAARELAAAAHYDNLGTFEFLLDAAPGEGEPFFAFIEANPRLQVEHTVTEAVLGVDLVQAQLQIAAGRSLADLGLLQTSIPQPRGYAVQLRINMEAMDEKGLVKPQGGTLAVFEPPSGPGLRVDTFGYAGYRTSAAFDSLLAKLIVHSGSPQFTDAVAKAYRAACEFRIEGVGTNLPFLKALLQHPAVAANAVTTRFVEEHVAELVRAGRDGTHRQLFFAPEAPAGAGAASSERPSAPSGTEPVPAPMQGTIVSIDVAVGDLVRPGQQVAVLEAMKMEHLISAGRGGIVRGLAAAKGDTLMSGESILFVEPADVEGQTDQSAEAVDLDAIRADLAHVLARQANLLDANRPQSVERRRKTNQRTARENIEQLVDPGTFMEYGGLAIAAQARRRSLDDLIINTPADGLIVGTASINGTQVPAERARSMVVAYDYTVLAGTQGKRNHKKLDRALHLAQQWELPLVLYAEGGGGRPGDTDGAGLTGLDTTSFVEFARLSGTVPIVGVVSGYCFAGNAALLGCCDVIIATRNSSIGMGGPAMIEGGGLGVYHPAEVGPVSTQVPNGVIDVLVEDEIEATEVARKYLSYFQGPIAEWEAADQRLLRRAIPENRLRVYEVRDVIELLADTGSVLELRPEFGVGIVTAFVRIEGKPFGLIANNPKHLGGAIDAPAGDKAARFIQMCDAFDLPIISLCDTPGFMVGPEAEKTGVVRHVCRMFLAGANATVPVFTVVLRKGYGLGAQGMAAGGFQAPFFTVAWPTGEFGGMGLEGYVRLGYRKEMEAIDDPVERQAYYEMMVARKYEEGKATSIATVLEIDNVIDPAETRSWLLRGLASTPAPKPVPGGKRAYIDAF
ncbi:carboxyl transferase domain-containing protein [Chelatococcus reniformis]|uniref:Pyruvate carboxylase n=1 Tax=Chelatococcus reniformis TaxID=1494448 RepID=A0A916UXH2_9HYPH|nr:carboxyl transferase domain-containing protein [Chelatococcus reniformis]GGC91531.1 pyruvate carboxylase [Chelatococcus reniformis]